MNTFLRSYHACHKRKQRPANLTKPSDQAYGTSEDSSGEDARGVSYDDWKHRSEQDADKGYCNDITNYGGCEPYYYFKTF